MGVEGAEVNAHVPGAVVAAECLAVGPGTGRETKAGSAALPVPVPAPAPFNVHARCAKLCGGVLKPP